ncbi:hypothetical protein [Pseudomonas sp. SMV7]|uniref:hypothetical protein n=1 Tax=Pseudomonas sp. SMV7 TaxID=3390194 RepID=UPI003F85F7A1
MSLSFTPAQALRANSLYRMSPMVAWLIEEIGTALAVSADLAGRHEMVDTLLQRIEDVMAGKPQACTFFAYQLQAWSRECHLPSERVAEFYMAARALKAMVESMSGAAPDSLDKNGSRFTR